MKDLKLDVRLAWVLAVVVSACGTSYTSAPRTATISVATDVGNIKNDGTKANVTVTTADAAGKAGTGTVTLTAPYGDVAASGTPTATLTLDASGVAKTTYACNVASEPRCLTASVTLTATWSAVSNAALLTVLAPSGTSDAGGPPPPPPPSDGGVSGVPAIAFVGVFPAYVIVSTAANAAQNLPATATATFSVTQGGVAVPGTAVTFAEKQGETLVTLGATSGTTDTSGNVTVTLTGKATIGLAHITASLGTGTPAAMTLPVLGGPSSIIETKVVPSVLGLKGSGIQETGVMTFLVTDSLGSPVPGVTVNFTQTQPALVSFGHTSAVTSDTGTVAVDYSSGTEVGVGSIIATLAAGGATTSHSVAVRGSKPSGSHFYFACEKGNLPVYTSTPRFEQMICTVRLGDRFGNRIGVSTPVYFATEAGTISAVATTKPFDFGTPDDPDEGSATVTFSTDMSNGIGPADVDPLPAAAGQYPWPRLAEPQVAAGSLVRNPRDQLVTIIAMTKGEEGFEDANHNGLLDNNEVFYDQGDPFIDANDDGAFDQIYTGGPWEVRFCGLNPDCSTYHGPNGTWDSQTVIWVPAWVVFTGVPSLTTTIAGQPPPASDYSPTCDTGKSFADIYVYDAFLNSPASGGTYSAPKLEVTGPTLAIKGSGFFPELDNWGAMGSLGFDFDYRVVSPTGGICQAPAVPTAPTACVQRLLFRDFDLGFRGTIEVDNSNTAACAPGNPFKSSIGFSGAHSTAPVGYQRGTFGP